MDECEQCGEGPAIEVPCGCVLCIGCAGDHHPDECDVRPGADASVPDGFPPEWRAKLDRFNADAELFRHDLRVYGEIVVGYDGRRIDPRTIDRDADPAVSAGRSGPRWPRRRS